MADRGLAPVEDALEIDGEEPFELLVGAFRDHLVVRDAGDVPHDVDAAEVGLGAVDERVDIGALRHVDALGHGLAAVGLDLLGGRLRAGLVDVAAHDRRARGREHVRRGLPDPARDAGQHRNLARQVEQILHACHGTPFDRSGENRSGAYATGPGPCRCGSGDPFRQARIAHNEPVIGEPVTGDAVTGDT